MLEDIKFGVSKKLLDALNKNEGNYVLGVNPPNEDDVIEFTLIRDGDKDIVTQWEGRYTMVNDYPVVLAVTEEVFDYTEEN